MKSVKIVENESLHSYDYLDHQEDYIPFKSDKFKNQRNSTSFRANHGTTLKQYKLRIPGLK